MTVRRLGAECDSAELCEWMAMDRLEPFGGQIDDLRAVIGPAHIINNMRRMFGGEEAALLDPRDLIPWGGPREPEPLLFDPSAPDYDVDAHSEALRAILTRVGRRGEA